MFDSDLPLVRQSLPWPLRLLLIALGLFVAGLPLWELGRALWPPNIVTPFFGIIIAGAAGIGFKVVATGLNGEGLEWRYPPGAVVVRRSSWRKHRETRLTAANVAAVEVRGGRSMDGDGVWRVVIVPKPSDSGQVRHQLRVRARRVSAKPKRGRSEVLQPEFPALTMTCPRKIHSDPFPATAELALPPIRAVAIRQRIRAFAQTSI